MEDFFSPSYEVLVSNFAGWNPMNIAQGVKKCQAVKVQRTRILQQQQQEELRSYVRHPFYLCVIFGRKKHSSPVTHSVKVMLPTFSLVEIWQFNVQMILNLSFGEVTFASLILHPVLLNIGWPIIVWQNNLNFLVSSKLKIKLKITVYCTVLKLENGWITVSKNRFRICNKHLLTVKPINNRLQFYYHLLSLVIICWNGIWWNTWQIMLITHYFQLALLI